MKKFKKLINDTDKILLFFTIFLIILGTLNLVTASSREAVGLNASIYHYFFEQLIFLGAILAVTPIILSMPTSKYKHLITPGYIIVLILMFSTFTVSNRGASNWTPIIPMQPSEFAKPLVIIALALYFEKYYKFFKTKPKTKDEKTLYYNKILTALVIGLTMPILIFLQRDLGTMTITLVTVVVIFLASPILRIFKFNLAQLAIFTLVGAFMLINIAGMPLLSEEQLDRFDFINPCSNYEEGGYQICNGYIAINEGSLFGLGIGKSKQKYSYIPEPHTDSVFAIFLEEWGLLVGTVVIGSYIVILKRMLLISSKATSVRGQLIALGVSVYMFMHILVNLGGLFGILPLTGVPLPFLSYGGSFTTTFICSIMIVQRINIETKRTKIKL